LPVPVQHSQAVFQRDDQLLRFISVYPTLLLKKLHFWLGACPLISTVKAVPYFFEIFLIFEYFRRVHYFGLQQLVTVMPGVRQLIIKFSLTGGDLLLRTAARSRVLNSCNLGQLSF